MFKEFVDKVLHREVHKKPHRISGSLGVYNCYKYLRKNKWFDIPRPLTEKEFYSIIRTINNLLKEELLGGNTIIFPHMLGSLELLKNKTKVEFKDGKLITNKRVNWNETLKLWHEDSECMNNKTLVRFNNEFNIKIHYNKCNAKYNNKVFFSFKPNKELNIAVKKRFNKGDIDAMQLNYDMG